MKPLDPIPQCVDCLKSMARDVIQLIDPSDQMVLEKVERISNDIIEDAKGSKPNSPQIANRILKKIRELTQVDDPYADFKSREMDQARKLFSQIKNEIPKGLRACAGLAALGNSFDFFNDPARALAEVPNHIRSGISFHHDDLDRLESFLANNPQRLLYLTDNAGEIYFDLPLYEYLGEHCQQIYLIVKGGPALNDLTRVELETAKLLDRFEHLADTGTDGAGIDWDTVSTEFLDLIASADLVVSKGMANFEMLFPKTISAPSFYLFKIKCDPIHNYIQAPLGSFMALWKDGK